MNDNVDKNHPNIHSHLGISIQYPGSSYAVTIEKDVCVIRHAETRMCHYQWFPEGNHVSKERAVLITQCIVGHIYNVIGLDNFDGMALMSLSAIAVVITSVWIMEKSQPNKAAALKERILRDKENGVGSTLQVSFDEDISVPPEQICTKILATSGIMTPNKLNELNDAGLIGKYDVIMPIKQFHYMEQSLFAETPFTIIT